MVASKWVPISGHANMILPRFGGQSDYAAIMDICIFNSNSIGLT